MLKRILSMLVLAMWAGAQTLAAQPGGDAVLRGDLGAQLDAYMSRLEAQGFSGGLLVAKGGEVVLSKGYGLADRARGLPFTNQTVFPIGSITKPLTAVAILKLEMMGKLHVEDPITRYFDDVPEDKAGITLHHLLTHSAGFRPALGDDFARVSRDEYVRLALASPLDFEPGTSYQYTNVGYSLLAAIVEQRSGQSYDAFAQAHLFGPAGMTKTGYAPARWQPDELAHGYRGDRDAGTLLDRAWADDGPYWHLRGNGGIHATLGDMYRWHLALTGEAVLSGAAKAKAYTPHVREGNQPSYYGYGWVVEETDRGRLIQHNGGNPYFSNDFLRYLDADVVLYVTSNTGDFRAPRYSATIADIAFGDPYELPPASIETIDEANLDKTPVGRRAKAFLEILRTTDEAATRRFIQDNFAARILEKYTTEDLLESLGRDQRTIGAVEVGRIVQSGTHELELTVTSKATGTAWRLMIRVEAEPPHGIDGLGVEHGGPMPPGPAAPTGPPPEGGTDWGLPGSPTGRAASAFLDAVSQADAAAHRTFVEERLTPDFRNAFPMDVHLEQLQRMHDDFGDFELFGVEKTGPNEAKLMLLQRASGRRFVVTLAVEPQPPHRIAGLEVEVQ